MFSESDHRPIRLVLRLPEESHRLFRSHSQPFERIAVVVEPFADGRCGSRPTLLDHLVNIKRILRRVSLVVLDERVLLLGNLNRAELLDVKRLTNVSGRPNRRELR